MRIGKLALWRCIAFLVASLVVVPVFAQEESQEKAEELMAWQINAVKDGSYERFLEHGNEAFREVTGKFEFEDYRLRWGDRAATGYALEYLGSIRRMGMREHLWRVQMEGEKYQRLGSLTLAGGKVAGFYVQ